MKDERYIRIARACLKAINSAQGDMDSKIQNVYEAIDEAFEKEQQQLLLDLGHTRDALKKIASADNLPEEITTLAKDALGKVVSKTNKVH